MSKERDWDIFLYLPCYKKGYRLQVLEIKLNQYHSCFYYKPPPRNFEMLKYLKKENLLKT